MNENTAKLSEGELKLLNEIVNHTRIIRSIVKPSVQSSDQVIHTFLKKGKGLEFGN